MLLALVVYKGTVISTIVIIKMSPNDVIARGKLIISSHAYDYYLASRLMS